MHTQRIILNQIRTPDGTILTSYHTHHNVTYVDANGERYVIDGGLDYLRRSSNKTPYKELSQYDNQPFSEIRKYLHVCEYNNGCHEPSQCIPIKDLEKSYIESILEEALPEVLQDYLPEELIYRKKWLQKLRRFAGSK